MRTRDFSRRRWAIFLTLASVLFFNAGIPSTVLAGGTLDGKGFTGEIGSQGGTKTVKDEFVFENGEFNSTLCNQFGYGKGAYQATAQGEVIDFQAVTLSGSGGKKSWSGTVKGDTIEGSISTSQNGETTEDVFKGTLKK